MARKGQMFSKPSRLTSHLVANPAEFVTNLKVGGASIVAARLSKQQSDLDMNPLGRYPDRLELLQKNLENQKKIAIARRKSLAAPRLEPTIPPKEVTSNVVTNDSVSS